VETETSVKVLQTTAAGIAYRRSAISAAATTSTVGGDVGGLPMSTADTVNGADSAETPIITGTFTSFTCGTSTHLDCMSTGT
jgi:hypothetical protein